MSLENEYLIIFVDLVMLKEKVAIFFYIDICNALVTGRVPKIFV